MNNPTWSLKLSGGPHDGKTLCGLHGDVSIPNYQKTDRQEDGFIIFEFIP